MARRTDSVAPQHDRAGAPMLLGLALLLGLAAGGCSRFAPASHTDGIASDVSAAKDLAVDRERDGRTPPPADGPVDHARPNEGLLDQTPDRFQPADVGSPDQSAPDQSTDSGTPDQATPDLCGPLVVGDPCVVDLSMCSEGQKASAWQGKTALSGTIIFGQYLATSGLLCQTPIPQAWPVITEPTWWCGVVAPKC